MKNQKGFSLIELLIVVVIIGIIAAIAIPNLLASRRSANEGSAIAAVRTFHSANATYHSTKGKNRYFANAPADLKAEELIDESLTKAFVTGETKNGYNFKYNGANVADSTAVSAPTQTAYNVTAAPVGAATSPTRTGTRHFYIDGRGVIHQADGVAADATSDPIG